MSRTVQMRQFEPATISMTVEAQIDVNDKADVVIAQTKEIVREEVEDEARKLKKQRRASLDDELEKTI